MYCTISHPCHDGLLLAGKTLAGERPGLQHLAPVPGLDLTTCLPRTVQAQRPQYLEYKASVQESLVMDDDILAHHSRAQPGKGGNRKPGYL